MKASSVFVFSFFLKKSGILWADEGSSGIVFTGERSVELYRKLDYPETLEEAACSPAFYKKIRDNFSILLRHFRWDRNDIFLKFGIIFFLHHRP